jgi:hypothetical protein
VLAVALPAAANGHAIVRATPTSITYESPDATSQNDLTVERTLTEIRLYDPTVDGGMDYGSCRPGQVKGGFVVEAFCPGTRVQSLTIDVADREDHVAVKLELPVTVLGGIGADRIETGSGGDTVRVRDGAGDTIACGAGTDSVEADHLDTVAADCENVTRADPPPSQGGPGPGGAPDTAKPDLSVQARRRQRVTRPIKVVAISNEAGSVAMSGFVTVGGARFPVRSKRVPVRTAGKGVAVSVRLRKSVRRRALRALRKGRKVRVRLGVVATDGAGNTDEARPPVIRLRR